tara:strand:+ start:1159 stop:1506 length:348 start_codon:yes stop_codon:yes gene_type:complete
MNNIQKNNRNSTFSRNKIKILLDKKIYWQNIKGQIIDVIKNLKNNEDNEDNEKNNLIKEKMIYYNDLLDFYNKKLKNICYVLENKCNHIVINDSIDISPDESQNITYCELCETTF